MKRLIVPLICFLVAFAVPLGIQASSDRIGHERITLAADADSLITFPGTARQVMIYPTSNEMWAKLHPWPANADSFPVPAVDGIVIESAWPTNGVHLWATGGGTTVDVYWFTR